MRLRRVLGYCAGECQVVDLACYEVTEDRLGGDGRRYSRPRVGECPGRGRHQLGQFGQPVCVLADEHRNPRRHDMAVPFSDAGEKMLPGCQGKRQPQGVGPIGQVRSDGDTRFQNVPLVAPLQQRDGLLRTQPKR